MSDTLTLTQAFTGKPLQFETARIRSVRELVEGPGAFGIGRAPGVPAQDFPIAWIRYDQPVSEAAPQGYNDLFVLQTAPEVDAALKAGVADLHSDPAARTRFRDYLVSLLGQGIEEVCAYTVFGTAEARPGTWRTGFTDGVPVARLIENLQAGRPQASETLDDLRGGLGRRAQAKTPEQAI